MKQTIITTLIVLLSGLAFPQQGQAQMRKFEQNMAKLKIKLPANIFDGESLNISTYEELQQLKQYGLNYRAFLKGALDAWNKLQNGKTEERRNQLVTYKSYFDAFLKAYLAKEKEIKPPEQKAPVPVKQVTLDDIYIGPGFSGKGPVIIDSIGQYDTELQAYGHPGTKAKPSRWSLKLKFYIKYENIAQDDAVMIEVLKDGKSLGEPASCQYAKLVKEGQLAYFKCDAPKKGSDFEKLLNTEGEHTVKLTYKKLIEGIEFKDFANFKVNVKQAMQGAANNPSLKWTTDHDMKLSVSTIEEEIPHGTPTDGGITGAIRFAFQKEDSIMTIRTWFKKDKGYHPTRMACLYKNKRVAEAQGHKGKEYSYWSYLKKGSMERNNSQWTQHYYQLNTLHPRPSPTGPKRDYFFLNKNPGDYRCVISGGGEVLKELFFKVGADGEIVKSACQLESMNTLHTVTLLAAKNHKLSTVAFDEKAGTRSGFEGRVRWSDSCPPKFE